MLYSDLCRTTCLGLAISAGAAATFAQGPINEVINLKLDHSVQVGSEILEPGEYTIRQVSSASNPSILEFTMDRGTKLATTITAVPMWQNIPPTKTRAELDNEGATARMTKLWIQGKNYGYEFPGEPISLQAAATATMQLQYQAEQPTTQTLAPVVADQQRPASQAPQPAAQTPEPRREEPAIIAQQQAPPPPQTPQPPAERPVTPETQAQPAPSPAPRADAQAESPRTNDRPAAAAQAPVNLDELPATALGWMNLVGLGFASAVAGLFLYRRVA